MVVKWWLLELDGGQAFSPVVVLALFLDRLGACTTAAYCTTFEANVGHNDIVISSEPHLTQRSSSTSPLIKRHSTASTLRTVAVLRGASDRLVTSPKTTSGIWHICENLYLAFDDEENIAAHAILLQDVVQNFVSIRQVRVLFAKRTCCNYVESHRLLENQPLPSRLHRQSSHVIACVARLAGGQASRWHLKGQPSPSSSAQELLSVPMPLHPYNQTTDAGDNGGGARHVHQDTNLTEEGARLEFSVGTLAIPTGDADATADQPVHGFRIVPFANDFVGRLVYVGRLSDDQEAQAGGRQCSSELVGGSGCGGGGVGFSCRCGAE
ncbi:hypothetical protein KC325_g295 [Hortaea werneckii]|nr:hypothetical protein KC325_g295 [Hortaea werneckii]